MRCRPLTSIVLVFMVLATVAAAKTAAWGARRAVEFSPRSVTTSPTISREVLRPGQNRVQLRSRPGHQLAPRRIAPQTVMSRRPVARLPQTAPRSTNATVRRFNPATARVLSSTARDFRVPRPSIGQSSR